MSPPDLMSHRPISLLQESRTRLLGIDMHAVVLKKGGAAAGHDPHDPHDPQQGTVFVLVHGLGMSGRYMMPSAEALAPHAVVHVVDLPGFGRSGNPNEVLDICGLADSLAAWMESNRVIRPCLLGNSLGAQVIADFCARHPGRVSSAVLISPTIDSGSRRFFTQLFRLMQDTFLEPPALVLTGIFDYFRAGFLRTARTLRHALADPVEEKFPLITVPVLLVRGVHDPIVPQDWMEEIHRLIPCSRLVQVRNAAHAVNFSHPEELTAEILDFLRHHGLHS